jgi:broad specificity phosphatase PhoE
MRTSLWFLRVGQSVYNRRRAFMGQADGGLTRLGQAQVHAAIEMIRRQRITRVYAAPQLICQEAAQIAVTQWQVPVTTETAWADQNLGQWTGLTWREAGRRDPAMMQVRMTDPVQSAPPGGESLAQVAERVMQGWRQLQQVAHGQRVIVVTAGLPIQIVLCTLLRVPLQNHWMWRMDYGGWTAIELYNGTPIVRCINQVPLVDLHE